MFYELQENFDINFSYNSTSDVWLGSYFDYH